MLKNIHETLGHISCAGQRRALPFGPPSPSRGCGSRGGMVRPSQYRRIV